MVMNWTLQLLSRNAVFLFQPIAFGNHTSISLLNMHLKAWVPRQSTRVFLVFSSTCYILVPNLSFITECCSHVWGGAPKSTLCLLDKVQSKVIRLINNFNLAKFLQYLSHRCLVTDLSIFYRYFNGHSSQEIRDIIPVTLRRVRTAKYSTYLYSPSFTI